jgi:hypothetical protein
MAKITKAERERRVSQIYELLIIGTPRPAILQFAAKIWGEVCDRSVDGYCADARKLMTQDLHDDRQVTLAEEIELRRHIIYQSLQDKKYGLALQAADSRAKLLGLFDSLDRAIEIVVAAGYEVVDPT